MLVFFLAMTAQHIGNWGQTLVEALRMKGFSDQAIVGNSGINMLALEGDDPNISFDNLALLFERAAELTEDDLIGFKHGESSDYRSGGIFAYLGVSSPTVGTLLRNLSRYQRVTGNALTIGTHTGDETGLFEWHFRVPSAVIRKQYVEFNGATLVNTIRRLTNRRVTPERVEFRHFRKANVTKISKFFGCSVTFGADKNRIAFKAADLNLPLQSADDRLYKILKKFSDEAIKKRSNNKPAVVATVEDCIAADPAKSQAEVAQDIGMSSRTLARRLTEAGTSFSRIVEAYREAMAKSMLIDTEFQLTEIAFVLGYRDSSTFSTAFKRWTNQTPTDYRGQNSK